jgi:hypothetical protein
LAATAATRTTRSTGLATGAATLLARATGGVTARAATIVFAVIAAWLAFAGKIGVTIGNCWLALRPSGEEQLFQIKFGSGVLRHK